MGDTLPSPRFKRACLLWQWEISQGFSVLPSPRKASAFSGQWPLSQGFWFCHSVQNGLYAGIRVSQAPIHRMSSKYANLEWLALFLANGHCHSTWGEKRLKHEFQSGMLAALHGFCPRHGNNLPKLQHDFVLIVVLRIVATVTAPGKEPR